MGAPNVPITPGSGSGIASDEIVFNLTGTVAKAGTTAVTGSGTAFTSQLSVGQVIRIPGTAVEDRIISSITSDTALTVSVAFVNTASAQVGQRVAQVQYIKIMDGTAAGTQAAIVNATGGLTVQGAQSTRSTGNITTASTTVGAFAAANYNIATVTVSGTYAGVNFGFFVSDDGGTTYYPIQGVRTDSYVSEITTGVLPANTLRAWDVPVGAFTHLKVVSTAYTSGTAVIGVTYQTMPFEPAPTVGISPGGGVGWTPYSFTALVGAVQTVKGTTAQLGGWVIYNPATTEAYVQCHDVASATTVTLGTTVPTYVITVPAKSTANVEMTGAINHNLGLKIAATTTPLGATAVTTGVVVALFYK